MLDTPANLAKPRSDLARADALNRPYHLTGRWSPLFPGRISAEMFGDCWPAERFGWNHRRGSGFVAVRDDLLPHGVVMVGFLSMVGSLKMAESSQLPSRSRSGVRLVGWMMIGVGVWNGLGGITLLLRSGSIRHTGGEIDAALTLGPVNPFDKPVLFGWLFFILGSCMALAGWGMLRGRRFARGLGIGALSVTAVLLCLWAATALVAAIDAEPTTPDRPPPILFASGNVVVLGFFVALCLGGVAFLARSKER